MGSTRIVQVGVALAVVSSVFAPARAELLKNFKVDGSIEVKTFGIDNETDRNGTADDYRSDMRTRVLVGGTSDLLDDAHARILLGKNNRLYGQGVESVQNVESAVGIHNAYLKIDKVFNAIDLTMGRQFYNNPTDFVIYYGPQPDDLLSITSIDAFRADADIAGVVKFQGLAGKTTESTPYAAAPAPSGPTAANTDTDVFGGELSLAKPTPVGGVGVYYYTRKNKAAKPPAVGNDTLNVGGVRLAGDVAGLGYRAELIQDFGRNNAAGVGAPTPAYHGSAYFAGLAYGYTVREIPLRFKADYGRGSRDFAAIAPGARFGLIWGEHTSEGPSTVNRGTGAAANGLSNLKVADIGLGANITPKLGIDLTAYRFRYDDGNVSFGGLTSAGTEYDLVLQWKHSENILFEANAASFQVGDALKNAGAPTNPITRLGADVSVKF